MNHLVIAAFQTLSPGPRWSDPENTSTRFLDIDYWTGLAEQLELGGFDFLFFADSYGYPTVDGGVIPHALRASITVPMGDPITIVSAVAAVTNRLGVVVTNSTTVERPAAVARRFATLDHLTKGRVGWNIVTGAAQSSSADLFGEEMILHDARYAQAEDHTEICLRLWEGSWADDALVANRETKVYADPERVRQIEYRGQHLSSRGILTLPPSPQRSPLLLQAGTSGAGREFAAKYAECVFLAGGDVAKVAASIADIRTRAETLGRSRDEIKFLVGAMFFIGATEAEAAEKRAGMLEDSTIESAATSYSWQTGIDITQFDLDAPLPDLSTEQGQSAVDRFKASATEAAPTVREILEDYRRNGINGTVFVGTPESVADDVEAFIEATNADGFLVQQGLVPSTYTDFIGLLMPVLRGRGLVSESLEPTTLRERIFPEGGDVLPHTHPGAKYRFA